MKGFSSGKAQQFFKVASSKNTQALSRALERVRASVGTSPSRLQASFCSATSETVGDGACSRTGSFGSSRFLVIHPRTHQHSPSEEMQLQMHIRRHQFRGLKVPSMQLHTQAESLTTTCSNQPKDTANFMTFTPSQLATTSMQVQQALRPPNKLTSHLQTVACSEKFTRHGGMLGVRRRSVNCIFLRDFHFWQCSLPYYGASQQNRITICARHFHTAKVVQQQSPSFQVEQDEDPTGLLSTEDDGLEIAKLPISRILVDNLARRGITKLFPIQRAVLEPGLKGQDLIARAKTGTGKTLAFGIPILDRIIKENENMNRRHGRPPLAVVMAPTRELAKQVETELKESAPTLELVCVYGGVSIDGQLRQLQRGVDIAVGTPGRFIDLLERGSLNLKEVKYIVLDEADRMLAVGFVEAVQKIFEYLPPIRQSMLFSATMPSWVQDLARRYLKNHLTVDLVGNREEKIAEGIKLLSITTPINGKLSILGDLLKVYGKGCKSIVFTQTKRDADDVAASLSKTIYCEALHGDITQFQRERTLKAFRDGKISVLIATDVAARGLDVPNVDLVVHYELANDSETFVHRSGRTGRAGKEGTAILMHTSYQRRTLEMLERELRCRFQSIEPPSAIDVIRSSGEHAAAKVRGVHPDVRNIFLPTAEKLLAEEGLGAFAAAIAHLCGYNEEMAFRSLLTHGTGLTTLKITRPGGLPILSASDVMRALSQLLPSAGNNLGKVCMLSGEAGAVFDLPANTAKELLSIKIESGEVIETLTKLPNNVVEPLGNDRFGGRPPFQRGPPSGRPGGSYGGRPGGFSNRPADGGNWSNRGSYGSDSSNRSSGGDWSSRPSSGYGSGSWGNRPSSSYDTTSTTGSSSYGGAYSANRLSATSSNTSGDFASRPFSGQCLKCGQSGHRAIECPR